MKIMIIGGYGQVGSLVTAKLYMQNHQNTIFIAGRNLNKAMKLQEQLKKEYSKVVMTKLECEEIDVTQNVAALLEDVDTVVMCLEENNEQLLKQCIQTRTNYIDITPSTQIIQNLLKQKEACEAAGIQVILGVGISPGYSNILAAHACKGLDTITEVETFLMLGVGESHGKNAVRWLVNNLNHKYLTDGNQGMEEVRSFCENRKQILQNGKAHDFTRIDLADSMINRHLFPGAKCNSWFAYDVNAYTKLVRGMQKIGMFSLLQFESMTKIYCRSFGLSMKISKLLHIGTDHYEVIVKASGMMNGRRVTITETFNGSCNNNITADAAVIAIHQTEEQRAGVFFLAEGKNIDM